MAERKDELDDFWDIDKLVPKKKVTGDFRAHTYDTHAETVIFTAKEKTSENKFKTIDMRSEDNRLTFARTEKKSRVPYEVYSPDTPFVEEVKIFKRTDFEYYSDFYNDGIKYLDAVSSDKGDVAFFSYVPQYSQLTDEQKNRYFYLRGLLRDGQKPEIEYSYLLLYIYELINVVNDRRKALDMLCFIWDGYSEKFPQLDSVMPEAITDYSLVHHLIPCPEMLGNVLSKAISRAKIGELFISADGDDKKRELVALIRKCSEYDYTKSKFATGENLALYEKYIPAGIEKLVDYFKDKNGFFVCTGELKRSAFVGMLCTPQNKYDIEVKYCSLSRSYEMRFLITDAVKHIENRIRAYIGVKSRLTVYSLPPEVRACLDEYLDRYISGKRQIKRPTSEVYEYDKLYDLPKKEFSLADAKKIEENSWNTTRILVETFNEDAKIENVNEVKKDTVMQTETRADDDIISALNEYMPFVKAALTGDFESEKSFAGKRGKFIDSVADEINEIAADVFGDIILEKEDNGYTVIPDYAEVFEND